jgi:hypothetical protein
MGRDIQPPGQLEDVIGRQDDLDSTTAGRKASDTGMATKLDPAFQCQFLGQDAGGVILLAEKGLPFDIQLVLIHYSTLSNMIADRSGRNIVAGCEFRIINMLSWRVKRNREIAIRWRGTRQIGQLPDG